MTTSSAFRCYYEDGTITTSDFCPDPNENGSPLTKSELSIIEDVNTTSCGLECLLLVLAMVYFSSKKRQ